MDWKKKWEHIHNHWDLEAYHNNQNNIILVILSQDISKTLLRIAINAYCEAITVEQVNKISCLQQDEHQNQHSCLSFFNKGMDLFQEAFEKRLKCMLQLICFSSWTFWMDDMKAFIYSMCSKARCINLRKHSWSDPVKLKITWKIVHRDFFIDIWGIFYISHGN